jgi:ABC-type glycerol-3-phosphate transport system permease component
MTTTGMAKTWRSERTRAPEWSRNLRHDWLIHLLIVLGLIIAFVPIILMLLISVKNMGQFITKPLGITFPLEWSNYEIAWKVLRRSIFNSLGMTTVTVFLSLTVSSLAAYAFSRFRFPGREALFWFYISVLFIPSILTFTTQYALVAQMGILDTYIVQILPYVAHAQIFQTVVLRAFFGGIATEILEAALVDGANAWQVFVRIVVPMSRPILATLAVMRALSFWDEWLWPLITITRWDLRPMGLQVFYLSSDIGAHVGRQMAGFVIASIPMIILFIIASKQFIEGLTSGAMKF